jgi:nicotinamidase-related amidase
MHPAEMGTQKSVLIALMKIIRDDATESITTVGMEKHMCVEYAACRNQHMKFIIVRTDMVPMHTAEVVLR